MTKNKASSPLSSLGEGHDLIVIAGVPNPLFDRVKNEFSNGARKIVGAPATPHDWKPIYSAGVVRQIIRQIADALKDYERPTPRRIITLYVPSSDAEILIGELDFFAYSTPIIPEGWSPTNSESTIAWRSDPAVVRPAVSAAIEKSYRDTNILKSKITDASLSPLSLPPKNFRFPSAAQEITDLYRDFRQRGFDPELNGLPSPRRFKRDEIDRRALGGSSAARFFMDEKGRVFPPHLEHGEPRHPVADGEIQSRLLALRQRYRFGVVARDGRLHFDVQYPTSPLHNEQMYCAHEGSVVVSGTHANVGLNDFIWVPDGDKRKAE